MFKAIKELNKPSRLLTLIQKFPNDHIDVDSEGRLYINDLPFKDHMRSYYANSYEIEEKMDNLTLTVSGFQGSYSSFTDERRDWYDYTYDVSCKFSLKNGMNEIAYGDFTRNVRTEADRNEYDSDNSLTIYDPEDNECDDEYGVEEILEDLVHNMASDFKDL